MSKINRKHKATLDDIFDRPTLANIDWKRIESLLIYLGAYVEERAGSRVAFELNETIGLFHRPHPQKEAPKRTVEDLREFLTNAGVVEEGGE